MPVEGPCNVQSQFGESSSMTLLCYGVTERNHMLSFVYVTVEARIQPIRVVVLLHVISVYGKENNQWVVCFKNKS